MTNLILNVIKKNRGIFRILITVTAVTNIPTAFFCEPHGIRVACFLYESMVLFAVYLESGATASFR